MQSWSIYGFDCLQAKRKADEIGPFCGGKNPDRDLGLDYGGDFFCVYIM
jgi:hypothetical protein